MKKNVFVLLLSLMFVSSLVFGGINHCVKGNPAIFSDDFESGNFNAWTGTYSGGGSATVVSTPVHIGSYAARFSVDGAGQHANAYETFASSYTEVYARCYFRISDATVKTRILTLTYASADVTTTLLLYWDGTQNCFTSEEKYPAGTFNTAVQTVNADTWYCLEIHFLKNVAGNYAIYFEANQIYSHDVNTSAAPDVNQLQAGMYNSSAAVDEFVDDVVVDSSYIGPIPDTAPPTFENISTSTNMAGSSCIFNCLISDDTNVSTYIFSTNNTGAWTNDTATAFSDFYNSTTAWANVTKTLNDTTGNTVSYLWYANDTSDNWGRSDQRNLTLTAPYIPGLQLTPINQTCRRIGETFTLNLTISDAVDVTSLEFEIHYNATLLNYSSITWTAWGSGSIIVDQTNGVINGSTSGTPLNDNQTLLGIQFTATYHHIWKVLLGWTNDVSDTIFIQSANLTSASKPDLTYIRGTISEINIGPDVTYTFSPIRGDVDNNGEVDVLDLRTVAFYYDQPNDTYNLIGDPTIDIYDLVVVASNHGYKY